MVSIPKVISFEESAEQSGSFGESADRVRVFEAHVSDPLGAEDALYQYDRKLQYGATHPTNRGMRVKKFSARMASKAQRENDKGWRFICAVQYSSDVSEPNENPLNVPAEIELNFINENRIVTEDYEGNRLVNRANQLIEGVEDSIPLAVFSFRANIPAEFPPWIVNYPRSMNSDSVSIRGLQVLPKTLQIGRFKIGPALELNNIRYSVLEMDVVHNPDTWVKTFLNRGTMELVVREKENTFGFERSIRLEPILDDTGKPVSEPQFLTEDGMVHRTRPGEKKIATQRRQLRSEDPLNEDLKIKTPLAPSDIITVEYTLRKPLPYNSILPV